MAVRLRVTIEPTEGRPPGDDGVGSAEQDERVAPETIGLTPVPTDDALPASQKLRRRLRWLWNEIKDRFRPIQSIGAVLHCHDVMNRSLRATFCSRYSTNAWLFHRIVVQIYVPSLPYTHSA